MFLTDIFPYYLSPDDGGAGADDDAGDDGGKKVASVTTEQLDSLKADILGEMGKLKDSIYGGVRKSIQDDLGKLSKKIDDMSKNTVNDDAKKAMDDDAKKLKELASKDTLSAADIQTLIENSSKKTLESIESIFTKTVTSFDGKIAAIEEKRKQGDWSKHLITEGIPEIFHTSVPMGDVDALAKVKEHLGKKEDKGTNGKGTTRKTIDVTAGDPNPSDADKGVQGKSGEMTTLLKEALKAGNLDKFEALIQKAIDEGIAVDDSVYALHAEALKKSKQAV